MKERFSTAGFTRRAAGIAMAVAVLTLSLSSCDESGAGQAAALGSSCAGQGEICLGIRYISYIDGDEAIVDQAGAVENVDATNRIWKQCGIQFQIDSYEAVNASDYGLLTRGAGVASQTSKVRATFNDGRSLLVVQTGDWGTTKNAWTAMPGSSSYGAIFEKNVADNAEIIAHELGHYLGLDHVSNKSNAMNAIIYPDSENLSDAQCETARQTVNSYWSGMMRG